MLDRAAARCLRGSLEGNAGLLPASLAEIAAILRQPGAQAPQPKSGELAPAFLGLLPTRACNFACRYCGFLDDPSAFLSMPLEMVQAAVNWYFDLAVQRSQPSVKIDFFGGEAFCAPQVLDLAVLLAEKRAAQAGLDLQFEVATNGAFSAERARWAADHIHTIVLSFDGPPEIQNRHRPYAGGQPSAEAVMRSARLLSQGMAELNLRCCVTDQTVERMPEIAAWFCQNFSPRRVCFEPLQPSHPAAAAGLEPPDPWVFAAQFSRAAAVLEEYEVEPVYNTADIHARRVSFCPVGQDVPIFSPDGTISACYLLEKEWQAQGLDLRLGRMAPNGPELDPARVAYARRLNVTEKPACQRCFARWHCAGGCHVNHRLPPEPGSFDGLCVETRAIAVRNILLTLGRGDLAAEWTASPTAMRASLLQPSDRLSDWEGL